MRKKARRTGWSAPLCLHVTKSGSLATTVSPYNIVSLVILCCYFQLLRKCILNMNNPTIEGPLGNPPFEKPSIAKVSFLNMVSLKEELWKQQI